jgi:hypothetical protein
MKKITLFAIYLSILMLTSCKVSEYLQIYKVKTEGKILNTDEIIFQDDNVNIYYNLWSKGGDIGFTFQNKTDKIITLDLTKTFFILNGYSNQYFQNRTYTNSTGSATSIASSFPFYGYNRISKTNMSITGNSQSILESPLINIAPKSKIDISEFKIVNSRHLSCEMPRYPNAKKNISLEYNQSDSPYKISNYITYYSNSDTINIENKFYVNEITNYNYKDATAVVDTNICGGKLETPISVIKDSKCNKFYIQYTK